MSRRRRAPQNDVTRRDFLWKGACAALTATGIASTISDLRLVRAATADQLAASNLGADYKALVCIFLFGGNDGNNVIIPVDSRYDSQYLPSRGILAIPQIGQPNGLLPLNPVGGGQPIYGLHPSCAALQNLHNSGKLAILCNVGTLLAPLTRDQYRAKSVAVPPQLFSHNDQQIEWQTAIEDQQPRTGWGGRCADLLLSLNSNNNVSMNISLAGANVFEVGETINPYNVSTSGAVSLNLPGTGQGPAQLQAMKDLLALNHGNLYQNAFASKMKTSIENANALNAAIAPTSAANYWTVPFPNSTLGNQLKMIARLIEASTALGHSRQIFFASVGGFDLHSTAGNFTGAHANLLSDLSNSMNAFYQATVQLNAQNNVTTFTASDFNRTFPVNTGDGSDHAWGNHQFILGGAVQGQRMYGTYPTLQVNGPDDTSTGRWIPTTSVEQYSATLAKWFGVSQSNLIEIFPYLGRFATPDLGFML